MNKAPAFQFYPNDWSRDLEEHPLEIEGAWIRIICKLSWSETRGTLTKTLTQWSRILRVGERKGLSILNYLFEQKIADVTFASDKNAPRSQHRGEKMIEKCLEQKAFLVKQKQSDKITGNTLVTITSRRMVHDEKIRQIRVEAGSKGGNPALKSQTRHDVLDKQILVKQNPTPSSSSSSSSSNKDNIVVSPANNGCPHKEIVGLYHEILPMLPRVRQWTPKRQKLLKARWTSAKENADLAWWADFFRYVREKCPHLTGTNDRNWTADLEWLCTEGNFVKVLEGRYEKR